MTGIRRKPNRQALLRPSEWPGALCWSLWIAWNLRGRAAHFARAVGFPLTAPFKVVRALAATLWNCRVLAGGRWDYYNRFDAHAGMNSMVYRTAALVLRRHGLDGICPYQGERDFPLWRWFYFTIPSLYLYQGASNVVVVLAMMIWLASHLAWMPGGEAHYVWAVVLALGLGSTFYFQTFLKQNYNALGWMFLPAGLQAILTGQYGIAAGIWLATSFFSITAVVSAGFLCLAAAVAHGVPAAVLTMVPAAIKVAGHAWAPLRAGGLRQTVMVTLHSVGFLDSKARMQRGFARTLSPRYVYFTALYAQFLVVGCLLGAEVWLMLAAVALQQVNDRIARFADEQSMEILVLSAAAATALAAQQWLLLPSLWLVAAALPHFVGRPSMWDQVPGFKPFPIGKVMAELEEFLSPVAGGEAVMFAFDDPAGSYARVFDGQRVLMEPLFHAAAERQILMLPNWWALYEANCRDLPPLWGRGLGSLTANCDSWDASWVIIYDRPDAPISEEVRSRLEVAAMVDWGRIADAVGFDLPYSGPAPRWWLVRRQGLTEARA